MKRAVLLFAVFILFTDVAIGQIRIRESVDINPGFKGADGIYDDTTRPIYLGVGGTLIVKLEQTWNLGVGLKKAVEETTGKKLVDVSDSEESPDSLIFENMAQWSKFVFYVDIGLPGGSVVHLYAGYGGSDVIRDAYTHYLYFRVHPFTPLQFADVVLSLKLLPNYSLDAIPPSEIYDGIYFVSPFTARDLVLPTGGEAFLTIDEANPTNQGDDLYTELPGQTLLVSNAPARVGDTIALGPVQCGEPLRLYLRSGKAVVAATNLYPEISQKGNIPFYLTNGERSTIPVFLPSGREAQIVGTMWFDDWTDLIYDKLTCTVHVISDTSNVFVQIDPPEVAPGDTATIIVRKHEDCGLTDYPPDQLFNVGISSDSCIGTILSTYWDDTWRYFTNTPAEFKFIAPDSIEGDSMKVEITVGLPDEGGVPCSVAPGGKSMNAKVSLSLDKPAGSNPRLSRPLNGMNPGNLADTASSHQVGKKTVSSEDDFTSSEYGVVVETIKKHIILLGETRYYYAVDDPDDAGRLIVGESFTPMNGRTDVTFDDPKIVKGDKIGVYWEYMDADENDLKVTKPGSIRLVGRYWEEGKTYKVKPTASAEGRTGSIDIEVKKPAKLGNAYSKAIDVFANPPYSVDNLCIKWGGLLGIPPQMIKGQMLQEADFKPAYRYEPFVDLFGQKEFSKRNYDRFRITSAVDPTGFGSVAIPSSHSNVFPFPYLKYQGTVWDYFSNHSKTLNPNVADVDNLYPMYNSNHQLLWAKDAAERYTNIILSYVNAGGDVSSAVQVGNNWMKNIYYEDQNLSLNVVAQTRMASSYGLLQILYGTASYKQRYPVDDTHAPEILNENETNLLYSTSYFLRLLNNEVQSKQSQWDNGFEHTLELIYSKYHGDKAISQYGRNVIDYGKNNFSPSN